jgi:hypothetical protein
MRRLGSACCVLLAASAAEAKTYQVAPAGGDFANLQAAADATQPGDVVVVHTGTYAPFVIRHSGTAGNPIVFQARAGDRPIVMGNVANALHNILLQSDQGDSSAIGYIVVEGFESANSGIDGIKAYNVHDTTISHCNIHHSGGQGILIVGSLRLTIDGNRISAGNQLGMQASLYHGIYITGNDDVIVNNVFYDNTGYGVQVAGYSIADHPTFVAGYDRVSHMVIANNTFAFEKVRGGVVVWKGYTGRCDDVSIFNNIFYKNAEDAAASGPNGVDLYDDSLSNVSIHDNLFFGAAPDISKGTTTFQGANNVHADPNFSDAAHSDFHLAVGSPAIDKGSNAGAPIVDLEGKSRPLGAGVDIGAYEFGVVPSADAGRDAARSDGDSTAMADGAALPATSEASTDVGTGGGVGDVMAVGTPALDASHDAAGSDVADQQSGGCGCTTAPHDRRSFAAGWLLGSLLATRRRCRTRAARPLADPAQGS